MALMIQKSQMTVIYVGAQFLSRRTYNLSKIGMRNFERTIRRVANMIAKRRIELAGIIAELAGMAGMIATNLVRRENKM